MRMVNKNHRISFYIPEELAQKVTEVARELKMTMSDFSREALQAAIDKIEKARLERDMIEGYKANYQYYLEQQEDWKYADKFI